jgi:hypothetical protein
VLIVGFKKEMFKEAGPTYALIINKPGQSVSECISQVGLKFLAEIIRWRMK